jgi:hypothetical protein
MMSKFFKVIALAAVHLAVSRAIVAVAMKIDMFAADTGWVTVALGKVLIALTRILYFPIITLSLYSRQWFPGNWIYVPICANSLIWGTAIALVLWWWRKHRQSE